MITNILISYSKQWIIFTVESQIQRGCYQKGEEIQLVEFSERKAIVKQRLM